MPAEMKPHVYENDKSYEIKCCSFSKEKKWNNDLSDILWLGVNYME